MSNTFASAADSIIRNWAEQNASARWNDKHPDNRWVAACGGDEQPFTIRGVRFLYCFNPYLGVHRYLNLDEDRVLEDDEFRAHRGW